jgi:phosphate transport system substrate-binding protein
MAVTLAVALTAAACSSSKKTSTTATTAASTATTAKAECATGTLSGAGSTFVANIEQQWAKDFQAQCAGTTINYQSVGSGAGIQQFIAGTVDFGASDALMKPDEESAATAKGGTVLTIPWSSGAIALEYNLSGVTDLQLSPETIAGIFAGKITKWNDAKVKADNPGASLPSAGIQVVHRSDGSGTTNALTSYLTAEAPAVWTYGAGKLWTSPAGQGAKGSDGVTAAVKQADGAIGYSEVSYAQSAGLGIAKVKNAGGAFVGPDAEAVAAALASATIPPDLKIKPNYGTTDPKAYPISTPTFVLVFQKQTDPAKGALLKAFLDYAIGAGQATAKDLYYAPLPTALQDKAKAAVASIQA